MSVVRHYSFKALRNLALVSLLGLGAGGCTTASLEQVASNDIALPASVKKVTPAKAGQPGVDTKIRTASASVVPAIEADEVRGSKPWKSRGSDLPGVQIEKQKNSAWCRYLTAEAEAERVILRSPTVDGNIDEEGVGGVGISYDFVDVAKADLKRDSAQARCRRYHALGQISRAVFITPQTLTYGGNLAKANYLAAKRGSLRSVKTKLNRHVNNGDMTVQTRTVLSQYADSIEAREPAARSEAQRRQTAGVLNPEALRGMDRELTEAERQLQEIERRSRSLEAFSVRASAGFGYEKDEGVRDDSGYAKLAVSYRLGAASAKRHAYEDAARQARLEALYEETHGVLWQPREMAAAIKRARSGIVAQRATLQKALAEAKRNVVVYSRGYDMELLPTRYRAEIDVIAISAEIAGLDATLKDMDRIEKNLRFR